ncbi:MAG: hypothetical protein M1840_000022 [Geoglossum simile]|nr:MAG: hypothetical protein M1840_000022 [Geoglossum simile]
MPIRWTIENDHLLLLKLLETNPSLTVDGKKIAAAWPTDRGEVPTPRAITEHIITIRKKATDGSATTPRGKKTTNPTSASNPTTPTKRRRSKVTKNVKFESLSDNSGLIYTSADDNGDEGSSSPTKKSRTTPSDSATHRQLYADGDESEELENATSRHFSGIAI